MEKKNFSTANIGRISELKDKAFGKRQGKFFAKDVLGLTSCEVSVNCLPAGSGNSFVHIHKENEELYIITGGKGIFFVDGQEFPIEEGSLIRVAPHSERALTAGDEDLSYICIQAEADSLKQSTLNDATVPATKESWMR